MHINRFNEDLKQYIVKECLKEKLSLIPDAKLVIISDFIESIWLAEEEMPRETLQVVLPKHRISVVTMLKLLNKRHETLDLLEVVLEIKRICSIPHLSEDHCSQVKVYENLSSLPRL